MFSVKSVTSILALYALGACVGNNENSSIDQWKSEILDTEKEFEQMVNTKGIREAFLFYAAEDAVLERNNVLHVGKESIADLFNKNQKTSLKLELYWKPDFVDVSSSGDLGYTYGKYDYITTDSTGKSENTTGVFHTVWKRQNDGSWKYVWD